VVYLVLAKSLAGAINLIFMVYPQKYKNCSTLVDILLKTSLIQAEKSYIEDNIDRHTSDIDLPPAPIWKICTSVPVWALILAQIGVSWSHYLILSETPTYLNNIQHIPLSIVSLNDY
jgi:hypothetical protein